MVGVKCPIIGFLSRAAKKELGKDSTGVGRPSKDEFKVKM